MFYIQSRNVTEEYRELTENAIFSSRDKKKTKMLLALVVMAAVMILMLPITVKADETGPLGTGPLNYPYFDDYPYDNAVGPVGVSGTSKDEVTGEDISAVFINENGVSYEEVLGAPTIAACYLVMDASSFSADEIAIDAVNRVVFFTGLTITNTDLDLYALAAGYTFVFLGENSVPYITIHPSDETDDLTIAVPSGSEFKITGDGDYYGCIGIEDPETGHYFNIVADTKMDVRANPASFMQDAIEHATQGKEYPLGYNVTFTTPDSYDMKLMNESVAEGDALVFTTDLPNKDLIDYLLIDMDTVVSNYKIDPMFGGSFRVTIPADEVQSWNLEEGTHSLVMVTYNGAVSAVQFNYTPAAAPVTPDTPAKPATPATGDPMMTYVVMASIAAAGVVTTVVIAKKRKVEE